MGQNPARQVALKSELPKEVICTTVNKVCASGLKAATLGAQSIKSGDANVVLVGGMESMSNVPYYLADARKGALGYGDKSLIDGVRKDGLTDAYDNVAMGEFAELCAKENELTREDSDVYAISSYKKAQNSIKNGTFEEEIIPVEVKNPKRGQPNLVIKNDEDPLKFIEEKIRTVKPAFPNAGTTVTAPNASSLNDGAAALLLVSGSWLTNQISSGFTPIQPVYELLNYADAECQPTHFTVAPATAIPKALTKANLTINDVDYFEINEAFSAVALANVKLLNIPQDKVNVHGGAVALGHPLGASGARILVTLLGVLNKKDAKVGVAGICNGGGGATAVVVKRVLGLGQQQQSKI